MPSYRAVRTQLSAAEDRSDGQDGPLLRPLIVVSVWKGDMLDLLKWRTHPDKITGCLSKLKEIDGSEIVKVCCFVTPLPEIPGTVCRGRTGDISLVHLHLLYPTVSTRYTGYLIWNFR